MPNFRIGCIKITFIMAALVALVGCATIITSKHADGSESVAKVGFGQTYNTETKTISTDPKVIDATAKAIVVVAKEAGTEIIDKLSKNALEAQKANKEQQ